MEIELSGGGGGGDRSDSGGGLKSEGKSPDKWKWSALEPVIE